MTNDNFLPQAFGEFLTTREDNIKWNDYHI